MNHFWFFESGTIRKIPLKEIYLIIPLKKTLLIIFQELKENTLKETLLIVPLKEKNC